jgi:FtsP/CotA-like multicopper oxidase with cupredoxin domain
VTAKTGKASAWLKTQEYRQGEDTYPEVNLMHVQVQNQQLKPALAPKFSIANLAVSPSKENLAKEEIAQYRVVTLSDTPDGTAMYINGNQFNRDKPAFPTPAKLGTVEEWTVLNTTGEIHPFHTHTDYFQVISINGVKQPFTGLQSDIPIPKQVNGVPGKAVIRIDFSDFTGPMMFHCHIAAHEHAGMMSFINVVT